MRILEYRDNRPHSIWHSMTLARRSMGALADLREVRKGHPDIGAIVSRSRSEREAKGSRRAQIKKLVPKLKSGTASMAQVQKVLAHLLGD